MDKEIMRLELLDDEGRYIKDIDPVTSSAAVVFPDNDTLEKKLADLNDNASLPSCISASSVTSMNQLLTSGVYAVKNVSDSMITNFSGSVVVFRYDIGDSEDYVLQMITYKKSTYLYFRGLKVNKTTNAIINKTVWRSIGNDGNATSVDGYRASNLEKRFYDKTTDDLDTILKPGVYTLVGCKGGGIPDGGDNTSFTGILFVDIIRQKVSGGYADDQVVQVAFPKAEDGINNLIYYRVGKLDLSGPEKKILKWYCNWKSSSSRQYRQSVSSLDTLCTPGIYSIGNCQGGGVPDGGVDTSFRGIVQAEIIKRPQWAGDNQLLQIAFPEAKKKNSPDVQYCTMYYRVGNIDADSGKIKDWYCNWNPMALMYDANGVSVLGKHHIDHGPTAGYPKTVFMLGDGISASEKSNAMRIERGGYVYAHNYASSGADYQVMFEWEDSNPDSEDRRGRFVTLNGNKIVLADEDTDDIFGIVACADSASIIEDSASENWAKKYKKDVFGGFVMEEYTDENGDVSVRRVLNPDYDATMTYVPRLHRSEWACVSGWAGKVVMTDDGSCEVNGYCKSGRGGIAVKSDDHTNYRVIRRIDDTHVEVVIL